MDCGVNVMFINFLFEFISLFCGFTTNLIERPQIMSNVVYVDESTVEPNDVLEDATNISYDECYNGVDWDTFVSGNLDSRYCDNDMYYFSIVSDYNVTINLNIDSLTIPFDFCIYYIDYDTLNDSNEAIKNYSDVYNDFSTNCEKEFKQILKPGLYVIIINIQANNYGDNIINYSLNCSFKNASSLSVEYIPDLKYNKNLSGALWIADYIPFDSKEALCNTDAICYYSSRDYDLSIYDHMLTDIYEMNPNNKMLAAKYYIWDKDIIDCMFSFFNYLYDETGQVITNYRKIKLNVEARMNYARGGLEIICTVLKCFSIDTDVAVETIELFYEELNESDLDLFEHLIQSQLPSDYVEKEVYHNAMQILASVTESWGDDVLCIPIYFKVIKENENLIPNNIKYKVSFSASYEVISSSIGFAYKDDYLSSYTYDYNGNCHSGKIYGLCGLDIDYGNLILASDFENVIREPIIMNERGDVDPLELGDYEWLLFESESQKDYYIIFDCKSNFEIQFFNSVVLGYDETNMLCKFVPNQIEYVYVEKDGEKQIDSIINIAYIIIKANPGDKYYLRICGSSFDAMQNLSYTIYEEPQDKIHEHVYYKYVWFNNNTHLSFCLCGYSKMLGHVKSSNSDYCLLCNGRCNVGFNPIPLKKENELEGDKE